MSTDDDDGQFWMRSQPQNGQAENETCRRYYLPLISRSTVVEGRQIKKWMEQS